MLAIEAIDHIVFNVRDVEASAAWYSQILGMKRVNTKSDQGDQRVSMTFGHNKINLRLVTASQEKWFTGSAPSAGGQDLCFLTNHSPDEVVAHLQSHNVKVELGPVTKSGARGPICSVYVRDPDGNLIEVASYQ